MKFRQDIQGLRAVAVGSVLATHAGLLVDGGFVGVDVFFVISGYLITGLIHADLVAGRFSISEFYRRRLLRILPVLVVVLIATLVAAYAIALPIDLLGAGKSAVAAVFSVSNIWFWSKAGYFTDEAKLNPLLHTWSLGVEEQFYILLPLVLVAVGRLWPRRLFLAVALLSGVSFVWAVWQTRVDPISAFYLLPARIWELGIGGLLAMRAPRPIEARPAWREAAAVLGLGAIAASVLFYDHRTSFPGLAAAPPCLGAALIIWAGQGTRTPLVNRLISWAPIVFVGTISYSLYLWHWPVLVFGDMLGYAHGMGKLALVALALVLAVVSWRVVERPFQDLRSRVSARQVFAGAAAAALALSLGCAAVIATAGFVDRLTPAERHLQTFVSYDTEAHYDYGDCFIGQEHPLRTYRPEHCLAGPSRVLLIGDSYGAHLLPGVRARFGDPRQATASGCLPLLGLVDKGAASCASVVARVLSSSYDLSGVDTVVIGGRWNEAAVSHVRPTLAALRARGVTVIFVGPQPEDVEPVARSLIQASRAGRAEPQSPLLARQWRLDAAMSEAATMPGVVYVSPMRRFCYATACVRMIDGDPLQWDAGHLTAKASVALLAAESPTPAPGA